MGVAQVGPLMSHGPPAPMCEKARNRLVFCPRFCLRFYSNTGTNLKLVVFDFFLKVLISTVKSLVKISPLTLTSPSATKLPCHFE